jgi:hypothetical protein
MYKIQNGEKGREIVATKNLEKDVIILKEHPSIICEDLYDCIYKLYNDEDNLELIDKYENMVPIVLDKFIIKQDELEKEISKLPEYMQDFFNNINVTRLRLLAAKFYRNAFNYSNQFGGPSAILFKGNIFNHSCIPNIDFYIDNNGYYIFKTNKFIKEGEELCDRYIDIHLSYKKREKLLLEQYGFICKCVKCTKSFI